MSYLRTDKVIGERYRIISLIGQGGMSSVFLAEDLKLKGKKWAVKVLPSGKETFDSFAEEAEMLMQLNHPQLPHIVDYFPPNEAGLSFVVMDYVEGPTLQHIFEKCEGEIDVSLILDYAIQLCGLLHYLHTFKIRPIIYRDLKPSNVMIDENNSVRLIDFGIARHYKIEQTADTVQIGTIGFAARELFTSVQSDCRSDLYSLGAMLYFLLSKGQYYFQTQTPIDKLRPDLPAGLNDIIHKLLQDDPDQRCQSALEVKEMLQMLTRAQLTGNRIDKLANHRSKSNVTIPNKLIVIGSLYPGAGSTFTSVSIARLLNHYGIPHVLVENPMIDPDLYTLLYGDKKAPKNYVFWSDEIIKGNALYQGDDKLKSWNDGHTTWLPVNPNGITDSWSTANTFQLLHSIKKPVVLWDVSIHWNERSVQDLCTIADEIFVVADLSPVKMNRPSSKQLIKQFTEQNLFKKNVHWIANRDMKTKYRKEWLLSFPQPPLCVWPDIPHEKLVHSIWKGDCVHDLPEVRVALMNAAQRLIQHIAPVHPLTKRESFVYNFVTFIKQKRKHR